MNIHRIRPDISVLSDSTHLPPAVGRTPEFLEMLAAAPNADPFVGPDQRALEQMLASFEPVASAT